MANTHSHATKLAPTQPVFIIQRIDGEACTKNRAFWSAPALPDYLNILRTARGKVKASIVADAFNFSTLIISFYDFF